MHHTAVEAANSLRTASYDFIDAARGDPPYAALYPNAKSDAKYSVPALVDM